MEELNNVLIAWITVFAFVLLIVSIIAYKRVRHLRLLFVSAAFVLFFIKGVLLTLSLAYREIEIAYSSLAIIIDLLILLFLAISILKR